MSKSDIPSENIRGASKSFEGVIRVMPDYFRSGKYLKDRQSQPHQSPEEKKQDPSVSAPRKIAIIPRWLIVSGLAFILIGGGLLSYFILIQSRNSLNEDPALTATLEAERLAQDALRKLAEAEEAERLRTQSQGLEQEAMSARDKKRIDDISSLQKSLELYFTDVKKYPSNLIGGDSLSEGERIYKESLPIDPKPEQYRYNYVVAPADMLSYTLAFTLEVGYGELPLGLNTVSSESHLTTDGSLIEVASKRRATAEAINLVLTSLDTDQDGLTDIEETLVYTTNKNEFDSDGDTYSDKQELINLYNPSGTAPIRLIDSGNVNDYINKSKGYSIYYPKKWVYKALDGSENEVLFTSTTGEFIEVLVVDNTKGVTLDQWYKDQFENEEYSPSQNVATNKNQLSGLRSPDRKNVYFSVKDKIFVLTYNTGNKMEADYVVTFEMMVKSFNVIEDMVAVDTTEEKSFVEDKPDTIKSAN